MARYTTTLIVDGDYFAAHLNNGGIRIGLKNVGALDVAANHSLFAAASAIKSEDDAEAFFDDFVAGALLS